MFTASSMFFALNSFAKTDTKMPVLFIGHGSPMNAISDNEFSQNWKKSAQNLPKPNAILVISAHWLTNGSYVTAMQKPKTIYDFYGFPDALYEASYPAQGAVKEALYTKELINNKTGVNLIKEDHEWGLDHGTWSVLNQMYPNANIPVYQLSIDYTKDTNYHYELAKNLQELRNKGILIIGSGNIVHNLRALENIDGGFHWAIEFDELAKKYLIEKNHKALIEYKKLGTSAHLSIPTDEHYIPLLYAMALQTNDDISFFNDKLVRGSISMRSVIFN